MKNNFIKRAIAALCACSVVFCAASCKPESNDDTTKVSGMAKVTYEGTHDFTAPERSDYFIKNGKTEYRLVVPAELTKYLKMAKREFTYLLSQATGVSIVCLDDTEVTDASNGKYISLGNTKLLENSGLTVDKKTLGTEGHRIVTVDDDVYLFGGSAEGTLYSVYTFMEINFNYDCFASDCITIDKNVTNVKMRDYAVTDIPDIPVRFKDGGALLPLSTAYDEYFPARMREIHPFWDSEYELAIYREFGEYKNGTQNTNTEEAVPRRGSLNLIETHGGWYSDNGEQLCYTAHGNAAEYKQMTQYVAAKIIDCFIAQPASDDDPPETVITISCEDNHSGCTCSACGRYATKYGTESAALIVFFNEVGRIVDEWCKGTPLDEIFDGSGDMSAHLRNLECLRNVDGDRSPYIRDDYHIIFFAYHMYTYAPCTYDAQGNPTPMSDEVKMRDNVGVWLANIYADYSLSVYDERNLQNAQNIRGWAALTDFVWNYSYWINFRSFNWFYDFFSYFTSEAYALMAASNTKTYYHQGNDGMSVASCFRQMGTYLNSKLAWNCSLNEVELMDKYFNAMYKDAAPIMKKLFNEERAHYINMNVKNKHYVSFSAGRGDVQNKENFPLQTMYSFLARCDEAMAAIEKYRTTDNDLYVTLKNHINTEKISPLYWILNHYADELSLKEKKRLISICDDMGKTLDLSLSKIAEGAGQSFKTFYQSL